MSDKKLATFDYAIKQLKFGIPKSMGFSTDEVASFKAALHLLEAAAKVDKQLCLHIFDRNTLFSDFDKGLKQIRALLASLPDKDKP